MASFEKNVGYTCYKNVLIDYFKMCNYDINDKGKYEKIEINDVKDDVIEVNVEINNIQGCVSELF